MEKFAIKVGIDQVEFEVKTHRNGKYVSGVNMFPINDYLTIVGVMEAPAMGIKNKTNTQARVKYYVTGKPVDFDEAELGEQVLIENSDFGKEFKIKDNYYEHEKVIERLRKQSPELMAGIAVAEEKSKSMTGLNVPSQAMPSKTFLEQKREQYADQAKIIGRETVFIVKHYLIHKHSIMSVYHVDFE